MNTSYRAESVAQALLPASWRRPIAGILALCAAASALWYMTSEDAPVTLAPSALTAITPADTVKTIQGDGSRVLHLFESVDCSFCRKQEPELSKVSNVTIYRHLLPGHEAHARVVAASVLCARDQAAEWMRVVAGMAIVERTCAGDGLDRNYALAKKIGIIGTPSFVFQSGRVVNGLVDSTRIEKLLGEK